MSDDKIAEIRARHAATEVYQQSLTDRVRMHDDRGYLLAEVERLRAEIERLTPLALGGWAGDSDPAAVLLEVEKLRAEIERLRAALKNIAALDPDVPDALVADALRGIVAQMGEIARKALEVKP